MNCREKQPVAPVRPRRTEEVARETLMGLLVESLALHKEDDPMAWDRLEAIGLEIAHTAKTTAREFRRRRMCVSVEVVIHADFPIRGL